MVKSTAQALATVSWWAEYAFLVRYQCYAMPTDRAIAQRRKSESTYQPIPNNHV